MVVTPRDGQHPTRSPRGALSNYRKAADEPDDHAIGRSRGGLTTKIHALTDPREAPVAVPLTAGQAGDNPQLVPLLDDYAAACKQQGASGRDFRLLGDKAYSYPSTRTELRSRRIKHTIPQRSDQIARRKAIGSTGGRPPALSNCQYLWIKIIYAASFVVVSPSGRSTSLPFSNLAPARTSATRWGAFTARQRDWAASISL